MSVKNKILIFGLALFHFIGIILMYNINWIAEFSYLNLILTSLIVLSGYKLNYSNFLLLFSIYLFGFIIELIGVKTHYLFGNYEYGNALGIKLMGVPIIIGLNWIVVIAASYSFCSTFIKNKSALIVTSAIAATMMDVFIEPVAIKYGFWSWENNIIPIFNFICWFIFSLLFSLIYSKLQKPYSIVNFYLFIIWLAFFLALNIIS